MLAGMKFSIIGTQNSHECICVSQLCTSHMSNACISLLLVTFTANMIVITRSGVAMSGGSDHFYISGCSFMLADKLEY